MTWSLLASVTRVSECYMARQAAGPRDLYLAPEARGTAPMVPAGTDLAVWTWADDKGQLFAVAFQGKSDKPLFRYRFRTEAERQKTIDHAADSRRLTIGEKLKSQQEKKDFAHNLKPGDILYSSWGYDQTNVDFYEVTASNGKQVVIREIAKRTVSSGSGSDKVVGVKGKFIGEALKKIPSAGYKGLPSVRLNSHSSASLWDGTPKHETSAGYGH